MISTTSAEKSRRACCAMRSGGIEYRLFNGPELGVSVNSLAVDGPFGVATAAMEADERRRAWNVLTASVTQAV